MCMPHGIFLHVLCARQTRRPQRSTEALFTARYVPSGMPTLDGPYEGNSISGATRHAARELRDVFFLYSKDLARPQIFAYPGGRSPPSLARILVVSKQIQAVVTRTTPFIPCRRSQRSGWCYANKVLVLPECDLRMLSTLPRLLENGLSG